MKKIAVADIPIETWQSPSGAFRGRSREVSIALGAVRNATLAAGGHPFDLELGELDPGFAGCPFHRHSSQWELFLILEGRGTVRHRGGAREVVAGDIVLHPPGAPHQLKNTGRSPLRYLLVTDNPKVDLWHYPDSDKWGYRPGGGTFRPTAIEYWHGEDPSVPPESPPSPGFPWADSHFASAEAIPWELRGSPKGKYQSYCRDLSLAVGGLRDTGVELGGGPFDLQTRRLPPGASVCPLHAHTTQWELFLFVAGTGTVRTTEGTTGVKAGDAVLQPPGKAHQLINTGTEDLVCHIVADNPPADIIYYPDSDKWGVKPGRKFFRITPVDYFDGEE